MSLITCGLADEIIFAELIPWGILYKTVEFEDYPLTKEFEIQLVSVEFDTEIVRVEFDPSPRIVEGC